MKAAPVRASARTARVGLIVAAALLFTAALSAQTYPIAEGYVSFALDHGDHGLGSINSPGIQFSGSYNAHRFVRVSGEFSGLFHGTNLFWNGEQMKLRDYHLLFGPELVFRNRSKVTPFVRVLGGYAVRHYNVDTNVYYCSDFTCDRKEFTVFGESGPAWGAGGGVDIALHPMIALRAVQFDFVRTHPTRDVNPWMPDASELPVLKSWQSHYRFGVGIVLRLGERRAGRR